MGNAKGNIYGKVAGLGKEFFEEQKLRIKYFLSFSFSIVAVAVAAGRGESEKQTYRRWIVMGLPDLRNVIPYFAKRGYLVLWSRKSYYICSTPFFFPRLRQVYCKKSRENVSFGRKLTLVCKMILIFMISVKGNSTSKMAPCHFLTKCGIFFQFIAKNLALPCKTGYGGRRTRFPCK